MRTIKFRGYSTDLNKWVYGDLVHDRVPHIWSEYGLLKVTPESVGQFTGLQDKDGVDIYEGDVLERRYLDRGNGIEFWNMQVLWEDGQWIIRCKNGTDDINGNSSRFCKIIGNTTTNPELLKP